MKSCATKKSLGALDLGKMTKFSYIFMAFNPKEQPPSQTKHKCHENKGNEHQEEKVLIFKQILLISTIGNIYGEQCGEYAS